MDKANDMNVLGKVRLLVSTIQDNGGHVDTIYVTPDFLKQVEQVAKEEHRLFKKRMPDFEPPLGNINTMYGFRVIEMKNQNHPLLAIDTEGYRYLVTDSNEVLKFWYTPKSFAGVTKR